MGNLQKKSTSRKEKAPAPAAALAERDSNRLEFFRHAVGLLPRVTDRTPGLAILVHGGHGEEASRSCSCRAARRRTCAHLLELAALAGHLEDSGSGTGLDAAFRGSVWYRLAKLLADDCDDTPEAVRFQLRRGAIDAGQVLGVMSSKGEELLVYASPGADQQRLLERCGQVPEPRDGGSRASLLRQLALLTLTESERRLLERGFRSYALAFQESFWYRFAYHLHREFDTTALRWRPEIDTSDGRFRVACREPEDRLLFTLTVPRLKVKRFLQTFRDHLQNDAGLGIDPVPLDVLFDVRLTNSADLSIRPTLRMLRQDGEYRTLKKVDFQRFRYGDLVYIAELGILADMQEIDTERRDVSLFGETVSLI